MRQVHVAYKELSVQLPVKGIERVEDTRIRRANPSTTLHQLDAPMAPHTLVHKFHIH